MQREIPSSLRRRRHRGNTIVLVTAILVLLVVVATAFVSRTRSVRQISAAQRSAAGSDARADWVAGNVAQEIASSLFARPIDPNDPFARVDASVTPQRVIASASWPKLAPALDAPRYSIDRDIGTGFPDPAFDYNFAPYEVRAWTNWPDHFGGDSPWPKGRGSPNGVVADEQLVGGATSGLPLGESNPYGAPGMGDARWLRSTEPVRVVDPASTSASGPVFTFSHWPHLSWLPTANNGWRLVTDISDIERTTVTELSEPEFLGTGRYAVAIPYEQWLPGVIPAPLPAVNPLDSSGHGAFIGQFSSRRDGWFDSYAFNYRSPSALPNFFSLRDLGRPLDEFRPNTARNIVSRTFTDTDGDGFTDSFWFVAPVSVDRGIRTLVGVSVVDNSALLDVNVATKFSFERTSGTTPSDLALVTSVEEFITPGTVDSVGLLDGPLNQRVTGAIPNANFFPTYWSPVPFSTPGSPAVRFDRERIGDFKELIGAGVPNSAPTERSLYPINFLEAIGMRAPYNVLGGQAPIAEQGPLSHPLFDRDPQIASELWGTFESPLERRSYFKLHGAGESVRGVGLTPFDSADEFELRAFHGNNMPTVLSRLEQSLSFYSPLIQDDPNESQFLRSNTTREENIEYLDQLNARQLLLDNRRKLTTVSGARNDIAPPALWPSPYYSSLLNYLEPGEPVPLPTDPSYGAFLEENQRVYQRQRLKIDLRPSLFPTDATGSDPVSAPAFDLEGALAWRKDIKDLLSRTMVHRYPDGPINRVDTYFGPDVGDTDVKRVRTMIDSFVANLESYSDGPRLDLPGNPQGIPNELPVVPNELPELTVLNAPPGAPAIPASGVFIPERSDTGPLEPIILGMERQPFIAEVFTGLIYPKTYLTTAELAQLNQAIQPDLRPDQRDEFLDIMNDVGDGTQQINNPQLLAQSHAFVSDRSRPALVIAIQVANPYDTPISLEGFRVTFYNRAFEFPNVELHPATLSGPSKATIYAISDVFSPYLRAGGVAVANSGGNSFPFPQGSIADAAQIMSVENQAFRQAVLDFLDLEREASDDDGDGVFEYATMYDSWADTPSVNPSDRSLVFDATDALAARIPPLVSTLDNYFDRGSGGTIEIQRRTIGPTAGGSPSVVWVTVDRLEYASPRVSAETGLGSTSPEYDQTPADAPRQSGFDTSLFLAASASVVPELTFADLVDRYLLGEGVAGQGNLPPEHRVEVTPPQGSAGWRTVVNGIKLRNPDDDFFFTWVRAARPWAMDVDTWQTDGQVRQAYRPDLAQNLRQISANELSPRFVFSVSTTAAAPSSASNIGLEHEVFINGQATGAVYGTSIKWERRNGLEFGDTDTTGAGAAPPAPFQVPSGYSSYKAQPQGVTVVGERSDPDGTYSGLGEPRDDYWASMVSNDPYGRLIASKPVFFTDVLYTVPQALTSNARRVAIYSLPNGQSMPYLLKYPQTTDVPDAADFARTTPWHRVVTAPGLSGPIECTVGGKGYAITPGNQPKPLDLFRFSQIPCLNQPFQLTQKDDDFEQVGEVLDVFIWGHLLVGTPIQRSYGAGASGVYPALQTFSETLVENDPTKYIYPGPSGPFLNRLNFELYQDQSRALWSSYREKPSTNPTELEPHPGHVPWRAASLPGLAFLDGLTVDGSGRSNPDRNQDGELGVVGSDPLYTEAARAAQRPLRLSSGYSGRPTRGLVNINTALPETIQALPLATRLSRLTQDTPAPYLRLATAIEAYRTKGSLGFARVDFGNGTATVPSAPLVNLNDYTPPSYADRGLFQQQIEDEIDAGVPYEPSFGTTQRPIRPFQGLRSESGFGGVSELLLMTRRPEITVPSHVPGLEAGVRNSYSIRALGLDLYDRNPLLPPAGNPPTLDDWADAYANSEDPSDFTARGAGPVFGTDRTRPWALAVPDDQAISVLNIDPSVLAEVARKEVEPAGDAEDLNLLFKGISNLVTTRSDVFTVYLRVRQVKQNSVTGVWDATNSESVLDDTRYVMCVDRSGCNTPLDQPRIVYFQKCP